MDMPITGSYRTSFHFRGTDYPARALPVSRELFGGLGFRAERFREGASIGLLSRSDFQAFARACGTDAEGGIYPLSANGQNEAVLRDELEYLPPGSRNLILPEEHADVSLVHELAHDVFIGGGIERRDRNEFFKNVLDWYRNAHDPLRIHLHKNQAYYARIAEMTKGTFDLSALSLKYFGPRHWLERDFRVFAAECFAYGCEAVRFPAGEFASLLPDQILSAVRNLRIFQLGVVREFQQATGRA